MASNVEEPLCWQCADYVNIFPEFMKSISNLKEKKKRTDEDHIIQYIISKGNIEITEETTIKEILEYAVATQYIHKSTYNNHFTYKINTEIEESK